MLSILPENQLKDSKIKKYYYQEYSTNLILIEKIIKDMHDIDHIYERIPQVMVLRTKKFNAKDLSFFYTLKELKDGGI